MASNKTVTLSDIEKLFDRKFEEKFSVVSLDLHNEIKVTAKSLSGQMKKMFALQNDNISSQFKSVNKRFDDMDQTFFDWKSEIFSKIDNDYATPLNRQGQETDALSTRMVEHHTAINKINIHLGFPSLAKF